MIGTERFKRVMIKLSRQLRPSSDTGLLLSLVMSLMAMSQLSAADPGMEAWREGDMEKAYGYYQGRLEKEGEDPVLNYNSGAALQGSNLPEEAESAYRRSLGSRDPELLNRANYNLARIYEQKGETEKALQHYRESILHDPGDMNAKAAFELLRQMQQEQEEEQQQEQEQEQEQNDDQNDQQQDSRQNKQEEREDEKQGDEQKQDDSQDENAPQSEQQQNMAEAQQDMDKEQIENILNAMRERELDSMKKLLQEKHKSAGIKRSRDW